MTAEKGAGLKRPTASDATASASERRARLSPGALLLLLPLLALLGLAIYMARVAWDMSDTDTVISVNAYIAMALGVAGTALITALLVWLLIHSNRRGYDQ